MPTPSSMKTPIEMPIDKDEWSAKQALLASILAIAVPLWIERLRNAGWEHMLLRAKECS